MSFLSLLITAFRCSGSLDSAAEGQVHCEAASTVRLHLKNINFAKAWKHLWEWWWWCWLGLFSGVINKVCGKQRGTESLWFTGNGWRCLRGGITTASCLKKYHKDQANPPITPTWSSSEEFMENGKGWSPINTDAIVCSSQAVPCYTTLLFHSAIPQFNPTPTHPPPCTLFPLLSGHDVNVGMSVVKRWKCVK